MLRCRYNKSRNPKYQASLSGSTENTISLGERTFWFTLQSANGKMQEMLGKGQEWQC